MYPNASMIGKHVKEIRESLEMTGLELAFRSKINRTYIHDIEKGNSNITVHKLIQICKAFEIPLSAFFKDIE